MIPSMHGDELPLLVICGFNLLLWSGLYTSRVPDDRKGIDVDSLGLVLTIQLTSQEPPYSTQVFGCG